MKSRSDLEDKNSNQEEKKIKYPSTKNGKFLYDIIVALFEKEAIDIKTIDINCFSEKDINNDQWFVDGNYKKDDIDIDIYDRLTWKKDDYDRFVRIRGHINGKKIDKEY